MKGIVLEVRGKKALVMAEDGSFRWIRCRYPLYVGQAVELEPERVPFWMAVPAALSVTAVLFLLFFLPRSLGKPVAYATLDINPSVEFGLDGRGRVSTAEGLDPEGGRVLKGVEVRGWPLSRAVEAVVERSREEGYLRPGGRIILALAPRRPAPLGEEVEREFRQAREVARKWARKEDLRVAEVVSPDPRAREEARKRKLSLGLYLVESAGAAGNLAPPAPRMEPEREPGPPLEPGRPPEEKRKPDRRRIDPGVPVLEAPDSPEREGEAGGSREQEDGSRRDSGAPDSREREGSAPKKEEREDGAVDVRERENGSLDSRKEESRSLDREKREKKEGKQEREREDEDEGD